MLAACRLGTVESRSSSGLITPVWGHILQNMVINEQNKLHRKEISY